MQGLRTGKINPAAYASGTRGRAKDDGTDRGTGKRVRTIRIQTDNGHAEERRIQDKPQEGGENMEAGRIENTHEAAQEGKALVE